MPYTFFFRFVSIQKRKRRFVVLFDSAACLRVAMVAYPQHVAVPSLNGLTLLVELASLIFFKAVSVDDDES
jgi:hypothetical protein